MEFALCICCRDEQFNSDFVRIEVADIQHHLSIEVISDGKIVGVAVRQVSGNHFHILPFPAEFLLPGSNFTSLGIVVCNDTVKPLGLRLIVLVDIIGKHTVGREVACNHCHSILDIFNPVCRASC